MTIGYIRRSLSYGGVWRIALALLQVLLQTANARNRREQQARNVTNGVDLISHSQLTTVPDINAFFNLNPDKTSLRIRTQNVNEQ